MSLMKDIKDGLWQSRRDGWRNVTKLVMSSRTRDALMAEIDEASLAVSFVDDIGEPPKLSKKERTHLPNLYTGGMMQIVIDDTDPGLIKGGMHFKTDDE